MHICFFFFQAEDGIRDDLVTGVQTCALPISSAEKLNARPPLVVFTTRLIATTFSFSSRSPALILFKITFAIVIIYECYLQITVPVIKIEVRLHGLRLL